MCKQMIIIKQKYLLETLQLLISEIFEIIQSEQCGPKQHI